MSSNSSPKNLYRPNRGEKLGYLGCGLLAGLLVVGSVVTAEHVNDITVSLMNGVAHVVDNDPSAPNGVSVEQQLIGGADSIGDGVSQP